MEHCHLSENYVWYDKIEFSFCVENYFVNNMGLFFKLCESQPLWMWWYTSHVVVNTVMEQHYHSLWVTFQFTLLCLFSTNSWGNYILTIFTIYWWNKCKKKKGESCRMRISVCWSLRETPFTFVTFFVIFISYAVTKILFIAALM